MNDYEFFSLSLDIGSEIIRNGGEINRAKDTILRINHSRQKECTVFALPDLICAQCEKFFIMKKINSHMLDMAELERLNSLSRRICKKGNCDIFITTNQSYSLKTFIIFNGLAVFCFCLFFGGSFIDSLISGVTGMLIAYAPYRKRDLPIFTANLIDAFVAGITAQIPSLFINEFNADKIITGAIMVLVPGINIQNAMRDMLSGDILAGVYELIESIMSALAIALSVALSIFIFKII